MIKIYMSQIKKLKTFSNDEHLEIFKQWKETGDQKLFNKLYNSLLLDTAKHTIKFWGVHNPQIMDLIQESNDALMRCIKRYDPQFNVSLKIYAYFSTRHASKRFYYWKSGVVTVPARKVKSMSASCVSLNDLPPHDDGSSSRRTYQDMIVSEEDTEKSAIAESSRKALIDTIHSAVAEPKYRGVFKQYYLADRTLQDIGNEVNLSRERVRQICENSKKTWLSYLKDRKIDATCLFA